MGRASPGVATGSRDQGLAEACRSALDSRQGPRRLPGSVAAALRDVAGLGLPRSVSPHEAGSRSAESVLITCGEKKRERGRQRSKSESLFSLMMGLHIYIAPERMRLKEHETTASIRKSRD